MWADGRLVGFDLETTSADPESARIVTASVVWYQPGGAVEKYAGMVAVDEDIPAEATEIHGITTERARHDGKPLMDVLNAIDTVLWTLWDDSSAPLVVFNAPYDLTVLDRERTRCGLEPMAIYPDRRPVVDPLVIDRAVDRYRRGPRKLGAMCEHYGCVLGSAHDSTEDALAAVRVAWKLARSYPAEVGEIPLPDLHCRQKVWHAEWAAQFQDYLRTRAPEPNPGVVIDGDWPVRSCR